MKFHFVPFEMPTDDSELIGRVVRIDKGSDRYGVVVHIERDGENKCYIWGAWGPTIDEAIERFEEYDAGESAKRYGRPVCNTTGLLWTEPKSIEHIDTIQKGC